jgi:hypothetical protein
MPASTQPGSPRYNAAQIETSKATTAKAAAAAIVITMATDVSNGNFAAASQKAADLAKRYGELSGSRLP